MPRAWRAVVLATTVALPHAAWGAEPTPAFTPSVNDFGGTGLLQMPNARFQDDGELSLGISSIDPYTRGYMTLQGLPWLEGTFRYTDIRNRLFSNRPKFSGDQTAKDRGADLKVRLQEETSDLPQIAVGLRDIGGTTLFGSEFLVASRRYYNWDFTLGLAWGNAGTRGHLPNPLGFLSDRFKTRTGGLGAGGIGLNFFQGDRVSVFGGIEYLTPLDGLRLKVEYDGNDYQKEPKRNRFETDLPVNFGAEYDLFPWFRMSAALERGNEFMLRGSVHANLSTDMGPPKVDRPAPLVPQRKSKTRPDYAGNEPGASAFVAAETAVAAGGASDAQAMAAAVDRLFDKLERLELDVSDIEFDGQQAILRVPAEGSRPSDAWLAEAALEVGRARLTGPLETVTFSATLGGLDISRTSLATADLERSKGLTGSAIALVKHPGPEWAAPFRLFDPNLQVADAVFAALEQAGLSADEISLDGSQVTIVLEDEATLPTDDTLVELTQAIGENFNAAMTVGSVAFVAEGTDLDVARRTFEVPERPYTDRQLAQGGDASGFELAALPSHRGIEGADTGNESMRRFAAAVFAELEQHGFFGERLDLDGLRATLYFSQNKYRNPARAVGRAARIVARHAPPHVEEISLVLAELGIPVLRTTIQRKDLERALLYAGSPEEMWQNAIIEAAATPASGTGIVNLERYPQFSWSVLPRLRQQIGGPDAFYFYQIWAQGSAGLALGPGLTVNGSVGVNLFNNFDALKLKSDSVLPHVRSDIKDYLKEGEQWIGNLHADYITKLAPEWYGRLSAGLFELMFGGVGGEVLYRPVGQRWAAGLDVNYVRQRAFDGRFGFQDYDVVTGHLSYYHRLPFYDILATVRAGQYLAKDKGATLELSRTFENGVTFGVFATKTNISSEEFGEGKFDKGFFVSVPMDLFFASPTRQHGGLTYRPLTRDGGQFLAIPAPLYSVTNPSDASAVGRGWAALLD
ncbi:MAG: YjbH domain-containing protein [Kiloniellaceae bacterium]